MTMKTRRKNFLSWSEAWQRLLSGEVVAACRLARCCDRYLRREAKRAGRKLIDEGVGIYMTYRLA